jgi:hypothetical protein
VGIGAHDAIPRQRARDLVVRVHGEETLVLDRRTGTVHCLPAEVTRVWGACTGRNTLAEVASAARVNERVAASAVGQLMSVDLLDDGAGFDRRKFLRRGALVGAGLAAAAPVIKSVVAPPAAAAASPSITLSQTCTGTNSRSLTFGLTGFPVNNYNINVTAPPAVGGTAFVSVTNTTSTFTGSGSFNIGNSVTTITVGVYVAGTTPPPYVKQQTFTCATCPTTPNPGPTSACTLP